MKYGFVIPGGDVRDFGELAAEAEAAGWDGMFVADGLDIGFKPDEPFPWFDPWVALAAMAVATQQIKLGTFITPVSRRRPWKLAREVSTLDQLSNGRMILGVGLGAAQDDGGFYKVGEATDLKVRAQLLDEGLSIMDGLWKGKTVDFKGLHYRVNKMKMLPRPVQKPRIPVWVVGVWPKQKSMMRVLRWDGLIPQPSGATPETKVKVSLFEDVRKYIDEHHPRPAKFDIISGGTTPGGNSKRAAQKVKPFAKAGATWWLEHMWEGDPQELKTRLKQGPPRID